MRIIKTETTVAAKCLEGLPALGATTVSTRYDVQESRYTYLDNSGLTLNGEHDQNLVVDTRFNVPDVVAEYIEQMHKLVLDSSFHGSDRHGERIATLQRFAQAMGLSYNAD